MGVQFAGNILVQSNGGPLPIANGGTGQTSATAAINALLPSQAGENTKVLRTDGTNVSWANASGAPGGSDTQIQYNDSGSFGGSSFLVVNKSTGAVTSTSTLTNQGLFVTGAAGTNRTLNLQTAGSDRWLARANSTSESGSNAGSNFQLIRVADNGSTQNTVFTVTRSTGVVDFAVAPTVAGVPIGGGAAGSTTGAVQWRSAGGEFAADANFIYDGNGSVSLSGSSQSINAAGSLSIANTGANVLYVTSSDQLRLSSGGSASINLVTNGSARVTINSSGAVLFNSTAGTSGQFLTTQGGSAVPIWSNDGSNLTSLNASNISTGTVGSARLGTGTANSSTFLRGDGTWSTVTAGVANALVGTGTATLNAANAGVYAGANGSFALMNFVDSSASAGNRVTSFQMRDGTGAFNMYFATDNLSSATAWLTATRSANTATNITLTGTAITLTGAVTGTSFSGGGSGLTSLNGSNISSGTVAPARLGTGTTDSTTYLRGDGQWTAFTLGTATSLAGTGTRTGSVNPTASGVFAGTGSGTPVVDMVAFGAPANTRTVTTQINNTTGEYFQAFINDAYNSSLNFLSVTRTSGTTTAATMSLRANSIDLLGLSTGLRIGGAAGTAGQVLTSQGAAAAPTWSAAPAAAAGTLTGATLAAGVTTSSLTTVGSGVTDGTFALGWKTIPQNSQSAAYTLVLADSGKQIFHPSADTTARTFTIPSNASVAYPIGTAVTFINQNAAGVISIAITTDTMRLAGAGTTGTRTLAANGIATAVKITSTEWIISGTGLT